MGEGREAASARVRPGTAGQPTATRVESGTPATAAAKANRGGSRVSTGERRSAGIAKPDMPDDLTMIAGIGPRIEAKLNELGIYTYAQIAAWNKSDRSRMDEQLKFRGRIEREDWVKQAKALAKGGEAEYLRVFGRKPR